MIHDEIDFGADAGANQTVNRTANQVKVLKNIIPENKYLNISVKGNGTNGAFTITNGGIEALSYDVSDDAGDVAVNGNVLSVPSGTNEAIQNMNFKLHTKSGLAEVAGSYRGNVIYNAEVGNKIDNKENDDRAYSSMLIAGTNFYKSIPSSARNIVFTDEKAPDGAQLTDLTASQDGDVVGWLDGTTWKVSSQDSNKRILFNTDSSSMFSFQTYLTEVTFNNIDTSKVTSMNGMFGMDQRLEEISGLNKFNTSNVTNMRSMFNACKSLGEIDLSSFDTSNVTDMGWMFGDPLPGKASMLYTIKGIENLNTSKVIDMENMFNNCSNLRSLNLSKWDTSNVTNMNCMFNGCFSLISLDISNLDTTNITDISDMFYGCDALSTVKVRSQVDSDNLKSKATSASSNIQFIVK